MSARRWILFSLLFGCAAHRAPRTGPQLDGPQQSELLAWRPYEEADKLYVLADPGDGVERFFLVDTGASVSVVTVEVAQALDLKIEDQGEQLVGLGGRASWLRASLPSVKLGRYEVPDVEVAVGVPGVPTMAGLAPVAGILGNNVWGRFQVTIDYKANLIALSRPGVTPIPASAAPMAFNGQHAATAVSLLVDDGDGEPTRQTVVLEIDTGARGIVLSGDGGAPLQPFATEGEEMILGVGAPDDVPVSNFFKLTRRVPLVGIEAGGALIRRDMELTWLNFDGETTPVGPPGMPGLLGHEALDGYRVMFDFPGGRFAILPSTEAPVHHDMHEHMERQLRGHHDPLSLLARAELRAWMEDEEGARELVEKVLEKQPTNLDARLLRAHIDRATGHPSEALAALRALTPKDLSESAEIVAVVNGLWLAGEGEAGLKLAERATTDAPTASEGWVALSDAARLSGDLDRAREALAETNRLDERPDGHLLRRALLATAENDRDGALTFARRLLDRAPGWGATLWFYAMLVAGTEDVDMFRADLDRVMRRLHPGDRPYDFAAAALLLIGDAKAAAELAELGRARDCTDGLEAPNRDNCEAWYLALGGLDLNSADERITRAVAAAPDRPEFLDTLAVVRLAQGRLPEARDAAWRAASSTPDDVYLLWQAWRIDAAARAAAPPTP